MGLGFDVSEEVACLVVPNLYDFLVRCDYLARRSVVLDGFDWRSVMVRECIEWHRVAHVVCQYFSFFSADSNLERRSGFKSNG